MINFLIGIIGFILLIFGQKIIKVIYLVMGLVFGFLFGYFIGQFLNSTLLSFINGITLAIVLGFFNWVHYKYFKGFSLWILSFALFFYLSLIIIEQTSLLLLIAVPAILSICLALINYKFEVFVTSLITSWLGAILIIHNIGGLIFNLEYNTVVAIYSLILGIIGYFIQYSLFLRKGSGLFIFFKKDT